MYYCLVIPLRITHSSNASLTYHSDEAFEPGSIVLVPVGNAIVPGIVTGKVSKPSFATKEVVRSLEKKALPGPLVKLASWMGEYYCTHPVTVWQTILPRGLQKTRRYKETINTFPNRNRTKIVLNKEQVSAISAVTSSSPGTVILHGITGSGKTQVYIELIKECLDSKKSVIVLVPEIALTSQLIAELKQHFVSIILTHSTMTEAERHIVWKNLLETDEPQVVVGPRSALFSPVANLGLIIIDECHEPGFQQDKSPRYSALRAASTLASLAGARLIMGSATPSITDYYLAKASKRPIIELNTSARAGTLEPSVSVVDMGNKQSFTRHRFLSNTLISSVKETLAAGHQALMFHNRRGTAPITICENCGWNAACPRCYLPLTLHSDRYELRCHICNYSERVPTGCPNCGQPNILHKGIGTKLLAEELSSLFPKANIARFDGDNDASERLEKQYQALYDGEIDIIIGTQIVAKGLDLPYLRMVGVVQADSGLSLPDYHSSERVFQLLSQVIGRVGRNEHASRVVIQSYQPTHPSITFGVTKDYAGFYNYAIEERKRAAFPPFSYLLKLTCTYRSEAAAIKSSRDLAGILRSRMPEGTRLMGPAPAFYERVRDNYRWQLLLKSPSRPELQKLLAHLPKQHWTFELDPASLL